MNVIQQIHHHRSIRKFKSDQVPDETVQAILSAGIRASSSGNMQSYSIIVTRDPDRRRALFQAHRKQEMILDAPIFLTFCADFHRMREWLRLNDAPDNFDNFLAFMIGAIDAVLVSQNAALAAESQGLGICYLGSTLVFADEVGQVLQLPETVVPVVGFCLGYPDEDPDLRHRLPYRGLVHQETYNDYTKEDIRDVYREKEDIDWQRYLASPRLRQQVEAQGIENLAQLYTTAKYTQAFHQEYSRKLLDYLARKGFMNHGA